MTVDDTQGSKDGKSPFGVQAAMSDGNLPPNKDAAGMAMPNKDVISTGTEGGYHVYPLQESFASVECHFRYCLLILVCSDLK